MAAPWEKYGGTAQPAPAAPKASPWAKYGGAPPAEVPLEDRVPVVGPTVAQPETSWLDDAISAVKNDPIIKMWGDGLATILKGAPETAAATAHNALVTAGAGLGSALEGPGYVDAMTSQYGYQPRGESAQRLTKGLGDALAPVEEMKGGLGDTVMGATGSPLAATAGYMIPDLAATIMGGPSVGSGVRKATRETVDPANMPPPRTAPRAFASEAEAAAAGLPDGTPITIGGVAGKWMN